MLIRDISPIQTDVMLTMKCWARKQNIPIPRKYVIVELRKLGIGEPSIIDALNSLLKKGYIRRAYSEKANTSLFVMIRNI